MPEALAIVQTVLAGISCFFSIIVLGITTGELYFTVAETTWCLLGKAPSITDERGCDSATAVGSIGLVVGIFYTVIHTVEMIQANALSVIATKVPLIIRGAVAGLMAFIWLICFGIVVDEYNQTFSYASQNVGGSKSGAQAVAAFSFLGIVTWGGLAVILIVFRAIRGDGDAAPAAK